MKQCPKCKQPKPLTEFHKDPKMQSGYKSKCKSCIKEYNQKNKEKIKEKTKEYKQKNKEKIKEKIKEYNQKNKEKIKEKTKEYNQKNKEKIKEKTKEYNQKNKEKISKQKNQYKKERKAKDPLYKLTINIRSLIGSSIRNNGYTKQSKTHEILGCSYQEFKAHIEQKFPEGMSWDNKHLWHLDHIIPQSLGQTEQEILALNHYSNFQPLWAEDNIQKSNNIHWQKCTEKYNGIYL